MRIRRTIRDLARRFGYEISPYDGNPMGRDSQADIRFHLQAEQHPSPLIFDVGANVGQSIDLFKKSMPGCRMISFEPCATTFELLNRKISQEGIQGVRTENLGMGSAKGRRTFREYSSSAMNSFLEPGADAAAYGELRRESMAEITTVDDYCAENGIERIDVLKSDAQGLDLEVFQGASRMFREHRVHLVLVEVVFSAIYQKQASALELLHFMEQAGLRLVSFYRFVYLRGEASWTDALFVDPAFIGRD
ncbi:MAG: FkbM family methyltransferase [Verrucomicrobiaceae bacterium]|nr:FkbM family methyltransferase [Verrucomicrobiaceae bacterium]